MRLVHLDVSRADHRVGERLTRGGFRANRGGLGRQTRPGTTRRGGGGSEPRGRTRRRWRPTGLRFDDENIAVRTSRRARLRWSGGGLRTPVGGTGRRLGRSGPRPTRPRRSTARSWGERLGFSVEERGQGPDRQECQGDDELVEAVKPHRTSVRLPENSWRPGPKAQPPVDSRRKLPPPAMAERISVSDWMLRRW